MQALTKAQAASVSGGLTVAIVQPITINGVTFNMTGGSTSGSSMTSGKSSSSSSTGNISNSSSNSSGGGMSISKSQTSTSGGIPSTISTISSWSF